MLLDVSEDSSSSRILVLLEELLRLTKSPRSSEDDVFPPLVNSAKRENWQKSVDVQRKRIKSGTLFLFLFHLPITIERGRIRFILLLLLS